MSERLNDQSGQISVFLSLLFFLMLGMSVLVFGGMREYAKSSLAEESFDHAGEDVLAQYDRALFQRYHVFMMDPREEAHIEEDGKASAEEVFATGSFFRGMEATISMESNEKALDDDGKALLNQIRKWETLRGIKKIPDAIKELLKSTEKKSVEKALSGVEEERKTEEDPDREKERGPETEEEKRTKKTWREWKEVLENILDSGILLYVIEDQDRISSLQLSSLKDLPSKEIRGNELFSSFDHLSLTGLSQLKELCRKGLKVDRNSSLLSSDACLIPYIFECFTHYRKGEKGDKTHCLHYEIEYMLGGKTKDKANLKVVADQIFLLRFLVNYGYAVTNPEIRGEAEAMAAILSGILGFPEGEKAVASLLIASLSYGESLLEVRALFSGEKVALVKSRDSWNLSFTNAAAKLAGHSAIKKVKNGAGYEQYLAGLLILRTGSRRLLYRMMDLMQINVALDEPGFLIKQCISSFSWKGSFTWTPFFRRVIGFGLVPSEKYTLEIEKTLFYD